MQAETQTQTQNASPAHRASGNLRRCAVSGHSLARQRLIRFAVAPDGTVTPDIAASLPGRGVWVTAKRSLIEKAVEGKCFTRAFKKNVSVPEDLADAVERLLVAHVIGLIGLARRAGDAIAGFEKCRAFLADINKRHAQIQIVAFAASDMSPGSAGKFFSILDRLPAAIRVHRVDRLSADELGRPFDRERVAQAIIRPGGLAVRLIVEANRLICVRPGVLDISDPLDGGYE